MTIRWVDNDFIVYKDPLELINVLKTDSATMPVLRIAQSNFASPLGNAKGQALNMLGHINGIAACMMSSQLFMYTAWPIVQTCAFKLQEGRWLQFTRAGKPAYKVFTKTFISEESMQSQLSQNSPSLQPLCPTRWAGVINSVLTNYEVLCDALCKLNEEGRNEYAMMAGGILNAMEKFCTFFGLHLSHLVFSATEQLSLSLQGKDTTIQEAIQASNLAIKYLERQRSDDAFNRFYDNLIKTSKELTSEPTLPQYAKHPRRIDGEPAHRLETPNVYFQKQYFELFDLARGELKRQFQQENGRCYY